jgi:hypothetical protein
VAHRYTVNSEHDGSVLEYAHYVWQAGPKSLMDLFRPVWGSKGMEAWAWFLGFGVLQAALQVFVPGSTFHGPVSPKGNVPIYKVRIPRRRPFVVARLPGTLGTNFTMELRQCLLVHSSASISRCGAHEITSLDCRQMECSALYSPPYSLLSAPSAF